VVAKKSVQFESHSVSVVVLEPKSEVLKTLNCSVDGSDTALAAKVWSSWMRRSSIVAGGVFEGGPVRKVVAAVIGVPNSS
jgi:hypothetical protein